MLQRTARLRAICLAVSPSSARRANLSARWYHADGRDRLSALWAPNAKERNVDFEKGWIALKDAGFLHQAHAGIYHLLPLGLRVQEKVEKLIERHMAKLGASKLSLSSISSESLWRQSGRLDNAELLRVRSRRSKEPDIEVDGLLLCPTHEEEITSLVARSVHSHKILPLRLYQISRKYRDELRPRGGLLRTREFIMKDLYTFDTDEHSAMQTYKSVLEVYRSLFDELKINYMVAEADSGAMGGNHSHEFHFVSSSGEDTLFTCNINGRPGCGYAANTEIITSRKGVKTSSHSLQDGDATLEGENEIRAGVGCPRCAQGQLTTERAIELGHTFHLGTRYSAPLGAVISKDQGGQMEEAPISMGCHGIGVSRMIAATSAVMADRHGLNWPRVIAPWEIVIIPGFKANVGDAERIYDILNQACQQYRGQREWATAPLLDTIIDDRDSSMISKLKDADLVGYPVIIVLGRSWHQHGKLEVQCRQKVLKVEVSPDCLANEVYNILEDL